MEKVVAPILAPQPRRVHFEGKPPGARAEFRGHRPLVVSATWTVSAAT